METTPTIISREKLVLCPEKEVNDTKLLLEWYQKQFPDVEFIRCDHASASSRFCSSMIVRNGRYGYPERIGCKEMYHCKHPLCMNRYYCDIHEDEHVKKFLDASEDVPDEPQTADSQKHFEEQWRHF